MTVRTFKIEDLAKLNITINTTIQFTVEEENNGIVSFFDMKIEKQLD